MKEKIKFIDLFAGMGGIRLGFENACKELEHDSECVFTAEIKPHALEVYNANFNESNKRTDITKIDEKTLPDFDYLLAGFPCCRAGSLITTQRGLIPIEDVTLDDYVLTHKNRFRKVLNLMYKEKKGIYKVNINSSPETYITEEHPYYVRELVNKKTKELSKPIWKDTKDLTQNDYVGVAINNNSTNVKNITLEECWLLGRYIADGYIKNGLRKGRLNSYNHIVTFCIGKSKIDIFKDKIKEYYVGITEERTSYKCRIINERFMNLCLECGKGASNKIIPHFILDLPKDYLNEFLDGYMLGDGYESKTNVFTASSVSKVLIYQLGQVIAKVFNRGYYISHKINKPTDIIENRIVNQKDYWSIRFKKISVGRDKFIYDNDILWFPVKEKIYDYDYNDYVYNLEVEEDNSYTVNNCIVHNCQAFSVAGKQRGFNDLTKGTLFFDVARIIKEKNPKGFILENVKGLIKHDSGRTLNIILNTLIDLGYHVEWKLINSIDAGLAQARERIYILGSKNEFVIPTINKQPKILGDIMEHDLPCIDNEFSQSVLSYYDKESLDNHIINDKTKRINYINTWNINLKGKTSNEERFIMDNILINREKSQWLKRSLIEKSYYSFTFYDLVSLCSPDIDENNLKELLDGLVAKKYLAINDYGYYIYGGLMSYEITRILGRTQPTQTLTALDTAFFGIIDNDGIRHLSQVECLRLFGFPDNYNINVSLNKFYDLIGNSVTPPVIKELALTLLTTI